MCLILSYNPEARVANADIICYKLVVKKANGIYNSLYRKFEYIIRRNYKIPEIEIFDGENEPYGNFDPLLNVVNLNISAEPSQSAHVIIGV